MTSPASQLFIAGCGDIGQRVASLAQASGLQVTALVRSTERARELNAQRIETIVGDLDDLSRPVPGLPTRGATILYTVPPPGGGVTDTRLRVFCGSIEPGEEPARFVYLSTTAVYGDHGGDRVDESTPPRPDTARGQRRFDAEGLVQQWGALRGISLAILRVAGIYGPGRFPLDRIRNGEPVLREDLAPPSHRIHADDLARICLAACLRAPAGSIYNVCDRSPSSLTSYFNAVADAFGLPRPPQVDRDEARQRMAPLLLSYFSEARQVDCSRLQELGVELLYPDLASGLAASIAADRLLRQRRA